ncbi:MAG: thermonuclease family protein, partial [bacterium]|nr:thermonuclease family protein [bacterium]
THFETRTLPRPLHYALPALLALAVLTVPSVATPTTPFPADTPLVVARIVDGDTFTFKNEDGTENSHSVRFVGLDTPERGRLLADEATNALEELIPPGTTVYLTPDADPRDGASPWRWLAYVRTDTCPDVGAELLRQGLAVAWRYQPNVKRYDDYRHLMYEAFLAQLGLFDPSAKTEDESLPAVYVASDQEDAYHRPTCEFAQRILEENFVAVYRVQLLETCGKSRCQSCLQDAWLWGD